MGGGRLIDGDAIIYIIARSRHRTEALYGPVVGTVMSNLGLEHALNRHGIPFERAQVGDRYILERLKSMGGVLGGEPSGHIICRDRTSTGDGIVSVLQVLADIAMTGKDLNGLVDDMESYPQRLINVRLARQVDVMSRSEVQEAVREAERELNGGGRVLLRPSGTEPLLRVMVEGRDETQVERLSERLADIVRELVEGAPA